MTSSAFDPLIIVSILTYCCICCMLLLFVLFIFLFIYYVIRKNKIESQNEFVSDIISQIWYRTILITPRGIFVVVMSALAILVSFASIDFSVVSTLAFFFLIIFGLIYLYAQIVNIYLFLRKTIFRQELVNTYLNFHSIQAGDSVKKEIQLKIPFIPGFVIRMMLFIPPKLGSEIRSAAGVKTKEFINFTTPLPKSKRGNFKIGPVIIEYEDILGFTRIQLSDSNKNPLKILPRVERVKKLFWKAASNKYGDDMVVKRLLNSDDFFELREYTRGDDIKKIHWKISAKTDKLMLRIPELTTVRVENFRIVIDNLVPGDSKLKIGNNVYGSDDILDRMIEISAAITDFVLTYGSEVELYYYISPSQLKKLTLKGKRREEWLEKLIDIEWQSKSSSSNSTFQLFKEDAGFSGAFFITSEISAARVNSLKSTIGNLDNLNFVYVEPSTFLAAEKQNKGGIISRIFLSNPYLDQYPALDRILSPKKKEFSKLQPKVLTQIKNASRSMVRYLRSLSKNIKVIEKNNNYVDILES